MFIFTNTMALITREREREREPGYVLMATERGSKTLKEIFY